MLERPEVASLPNVPGSYQFRDAEDRVIYVGKAKSLRSRILSYFANPTSLSGKTQAMLQVASSLTWITVNSDVEAFILEYNLIKEHRPRYNIRLRDDKSYPMIAVTTDETWPRAMLVRGKRRPRVRYFGPYPNSRAARETLDLLLRTLPLRTCSPAKLSHHTREGRPCLNYHIGRCVGPCIQAVTQADYSAMVGSVARFLGGNGSGLADEIDERMRASATALDFEAAARYRDQLSALRTVLERQEMVLAGGESLDIFGFFSDDLELAVQVVRVRNGRVVGTKGFVIDRVEDLSDSEVLVRAIELYYADSAIDYPGRVVVPIALVEAPRLTQLLSDLAERPIRVVVGSRGRQRALIEMAGRNALEEFRRSRLKRATDYNARSEALTEMKTLLELREPPLRIECYDMSHLQGSNYVGSMVVMEDGLMKHSDYRHFAVSIPGNDDFAAMREVLTRRLTRLMEEENETQPTNRIRRFAYRPQLILLDGGAGQLSVGKEVLQAFGRDEDIALAALAKSFEEIYRPDLSGPLRIPRGSTSLYLLQQLRDEAHRFAISYHRRRRTLSQEQSVLDSIPGLGPKRRAALLERFGSIYELTEAGEEGIVASKIVPTSVARAIATTLDAVYERKKG
ncbi:MAG: excinuclease ABC subunit UvrC [Ferrimicrobium sp.]